ncbi:hypothetical protein SAMN05421823_105215 [Catalinimonas alkaloidigena]|uniref:Uncharacterized protein n=1 Tax=Catalinimonas alkaloidigena TaxID=1075417 RepID=A0A1G9J5Y8_9BACT|nr:hypothetical protein [Catalinimonas alkaloidigena]SDL32957.1 hypothetical protein SAMN05421823_105215 [Catalinimonas alkaloidigena]
MGFASQSQDRFEQNRNLLGKRTTFEAISDRYRRYRRYRRGALHLKKASPQEVDVWRRKMQAVRRDENFKWALVLTGVLLLAGALLWRAFGK